VVLRHNALYPLLRKDLDDGEAAAIALAIEQHADLILLDETDARVSAALAPLAGRTMLVFHPAYGYFTRRYGLIQKAIEVDGRDPSARRLATVVDEIRKQPVPALFIQPQFSRSAAERVANALDCELVELDPLAADYLANLENMADRIVRALQ